MTPLQCSHPSLSTPYPNDILIISLFDTPPSTDFFPLFHNFRLKEERERKEREEREKEIEDTDHVSVESGEPLEWSKEELVIFVRPLGAT